MREKTKKYKFQHFSQYYYKQNKNEKLSVLASCNQTVPLQHPQNNHNKNNDDEKKEKKYLTE